MLAALAEAGRRLDRDDWVDAARAAGGIPARAALDAGRAAAPHLADGRAKGTRLPRGLRRRRATACSSCTSRRARCAGSRRRRRLALLAVELFADDERGGFFLAPSDGEQLVARKKELDDHPTPSGNSMLAYVLLRLGADLRRRRARAPRRLGLPAAPPARSARARPPFGHALCALDLYLSPPRRSRSSAPRGRGRPRRAPAVRAERGRRLRPGRGRAAAGGEDPGGRPPGRLRVRALRVPGAGHGRGCSQRGTRALVRDDLRALTKSLEVNALRKESQ